jgi:hypothetical protein
MVFLVTRRQAEPANRSALRPSQFAVAGCVTHRALTAGHWIRSAASVRRCSTALANQVCYNDVQKCNSSCPISTACNNPICGPLSRAVLISTEDRAPEVAPTGHGPGEWTSDWYATRAAPAATCARSHLPARSPPQILSLLRPRRSRSETSADCRNHELAAVSVSPSARAATSAPCLPSTGAAVRISRQIYVDRPRSSRSRSPAAGP